MTDHETEQQKRINKAVQDALNFNFATREEVKEALSTDTPVDHNGDPLTGYGRSNAVFDQSKRMIEQTTDEHDDTHPLEEGIEAAERGDTAELEDIMNTIEEDEQEALDAMIDIDDLRDGDVTTERDLQRNSDE